MSQIEFFNFFAEYGIVILLLIIIYSILLLIFTIAGYAEKCKQTEELQAIRKGMGLKLEINNEEETE